MRGRLTFDEVRGIVVEQYPEFTEIGADEFANFLLRIIDTEYQRGIAAARVIVWEESVRLGGGSIDNAIDKIDDALRASTALPETGTEEEEGG